MSEYLLEQTPTKTITARRLWEMVKAPSCSPSTTSSATSKPTGSTPTAAPTS